MVVLGQLVGVPWWLQLLGLGTVAGALALSVWAAAGVARATRKLPRFPQGRCAECGYDLRGSEGPCPECGATRA